MKVTPEAMADLGFRPFAASGQYVPVKFPHACAIGSDQTLEEAYLYILKLELERQEAEILGNIHRSLGLARPR